MCFSKLFSLALLSLKLFIIFDCYLYLIGTILSYVIPCFLDSSSHLFNAPSFYREIYKAFSEIIVLLLALSCDLDGFT